MTRASHDHGKPRFPSPRFAVALLGFLAIAGYFLVAEHRAHLLPYLGYLPYLLLLACPLMHLFMHGGHGHHDGRPGSRAGES